MGQMEELAKAAGAEVACKRLREVLEVIEEESEYQGVFSDDKMRGAFKNDEDRDQALQVLSEWKLSMKPELEAALGDCDLPTVEGLLARIDHVTRDFMVRAGARYANLLREELVDPECAGH